MIMKDLLLLVQPLEKWHLDMGLAEEVRDEIFYLQWGLARHPVERDEERGWNAIRGKGDKGKGKQREMVKEAGKEGEDGEGGSEVGSERSRSAVVSGHVRDDHHEEDEERSAHSDGEGEGDHHPPNHTSAHSSQAEPAENSTRPSIGASTHASEPGISTAPNRNTHTPPHTPKPAPKKQSSNQPRFKIRNPWHAYIEDLVAAKVVEHLEWQKQARLGAGTGSLGPASHSGSRANRDKLHAMPEDEEEEEEREQASHPPPPAAGAIANSAIRSGKRHASAVGNNSGPPHPRGQRRGKMLAWVKAAAKKALEPPPPAPARDRKAERPKERHVNGPRAVESVAINRTRSMRGAGSVPGRGSRRGSGYDSDEEDGDEELSGGSIGDAHGHGKGGDGGRAWRRTCGGGWNMGIGHEDERDEEDGHETRARTRAWTRARN